MKQKFLSDLIEQASMCSTFGLSFSVSNKYGTGNITLPDELRVNEKEFLAALEKLGLTTCERIENTQKITPKVVRIIEKEKEGAVRELVDDGKLLTQKQATKIYYAICYCALDELGYRFEVKKDRLELKKYCLLFNQAGTRDTLRGTIERLHTVKQAGDIKNYIKDIIQGKGTN